MTKLLEKKVVVITGGAGLIGRELSKTIAEQGGTAVVVDVDNQRGGRVVDSLKKQVCSVDVIFLELDITSKKSINKVIKTVHDRYGRIDALINNAYPRNKNYGNQFLEVEYEDFCDNVSKHLGGYFLTSQQFIKYFLDQGFGNIVNMSSIYGTIAPKFNIYSGTSMTVPVEYAAAKSALIQLTKYMANFCHGKDIRVNSVSPGGILDGQPEAFLEKYNAHCLNKGMLDVGDINGTLLYLLSDMSKFVNGQNIIVDDGFTL